MNFEIQSWVLDVVEKAFACTREKKHPTFAIIPKPFKDMFIKKEDDYRELQII